VFHFLEVAGVIKMDDGPLGLEDLLGPDSSGGGQQDKEDYEEQTQKEIRTGQPTTTAGPGGGIFRQSPTKILHGVASKWVYQAPGSLGSASINNLQIQDGGEVSTSESGCKVNYFILIKKYYIFLFIKGKFLEGLMARGFPRSEVSGPELIC
jgi:hypothetical protein